MNQGSAIKLQALLDTAVDGIITIDEAGLIQSFNKAAERIFGYRADEVIGRNVNLLMPQPYQRDHDAYIANYLHGGQKKIIGIGREVQGLRKDGRVFPLDLAVGEARIGEQRLFTGIVRDISDRKRLEQEAHRRLQELAHVSRLNTASGLAAGLAHEVNQPLTAIISHAQACLRLLQRGELDPELFGESLQQIARQGERASGVIRRLRDFVKKGESQLAPDFLNATVRDVVWLMAHELKGQAVTLELALQDDLPQVMVDRIQIEQVLFNLIRNAMDAVAEVDPERKRIVIATHQDAATRTVRLEVRDHGPGIAEAALPRLFEPFFSTKREGLGQGLSICRSIVQAHHGELSADNLAPGARFTVTLPALPA